MKPVPHADELPAPQPPSNGEITLPQAELQEGPLNPVTYPRVIKVHIRSSKAGYNDLVRDLNLPRQQAELIKIKTAAVELSA
jgi:hypothetical protein